MNIKIQRNIVKEKPSRIQFITIENHELKHHDKNKVVIIPDISNEQWQKDIQESPKSFCVNFEVFSINENTLIFDTPSTVSEEAIAKQVQIWFNKKYPPIGAY